MLPLRIGRSGMYLFIHPFPMFMCSPSLPLRLRTGRYISLPFSMVYLPVLAQHNSYMIETRFVCCVKVLSFALRAFQYSLWWGTRQPLPFLQWLRAARRFLPGKCAGRLGFFWPQALLQNSVKWKRLKN